MSLLGLRKMRMKLGILKQSLSSIDCTFQVPNFIMLCLGANCCLVAEVSLDKIKRMFVAKRAYTSWCAWYRDKNGGEILVD